MAKRSKTPTMEIAFECETIFVDATCKLHDEQPALNYVKLNVNKYFLQPLPEYIEKTDFFPDHREGDMRARGVQGQARQRNIGGTGAVFVCQALRGSHDGLGREGHVEHKCHEQLQQALTQVKSGLCCTPRAATVRAVVSQKNRSRGHQYDVHGCFPDE